MRRKGAALVAALLAGLMTAAYLLSGGERAKEEEAELFASLLTSPPVSVAKPGGPDSNSPSPKDEASEESHEFHRSPNARWGKWEHSKIEDWLNQGDACSLLRSKLVYEAPLREILPHLLSRTSAPSSSSLPREVLEDLAEAFSAEREEEILAPLRRHSHPVLRFYEALILAGFLEGIRGPVTLNLPQSAALLEALTQAQKNNGAYFLYLAKVKQNLGTSPALTRSLLRAGFSAPDFTTFTNEIMQSVQERGLQNPAYWPLSESFRIHLPIAQYGVLRSAISEVLKISDAGFADEAYAFAVKVMKKNEAAAGGTDVIHWLALEHAIAKSIAKEAWKKNHPGEELPAIASGDYRELRKLSLLQREMPDALSDAFFQEESCEKSYPKLFGLLLKERQELSPATNSGRR